jgi:hypothetical protein
MSKTLIILAAVVVLIVIVVLTGLRYLRSDEDTEEVAAADRPHDPADDRLASASRTEPADAFAASRTAGPPTDAAPSRSGRPAEPAPVGRTGPRRDTRTSRRRSGGEKAPARGRGGRNKRSEEDWPASDWDSLSDVDYWAEVTADKPLSRSPAASGPRLASPDVATITARAGAQRSPAAEDTSLAARDTVIQLRQAPARQQPATGSMDRTRQLHHGSRSGAGRRSQQAAGGPVPRGPAAARDQQGLAALAAQSPEPARHLAPLSADDDPLTSPTFPRIAAADSRSYRRSEPESAFHDSQFPRSPFSDPGHLPASYLAAPGPDDSGSGARAAAADLPPAGLPPRPPVPGDRAGGRRAAGQRSGPYPPLGATEQDSPRQAAGSGEPSRWTGAGTYRPLTAAPYGAGNAGRAAQADRLPVPAADAGGRRAANPHDAGLPGDPYQAADRSVSRPDRGRGAHAAGRRGNRHRAAESPGDSAAAASHEVSRSPATSAAWYPEMARDGELTGGPDGGQGMERDPLAGPGSGRASGRGRGGPSHAAGRHPAGRFEPAGYQAGYWQGRPEADPHRTDRLSS